MKKLDYTLTSCEQRMPLLLTPLPVEISSMPSPNRHIFGNYRKGTQEWVNQSSTTTLHITKRLNGGLCERREESNEADVERWIATTSAHAY